MRLRLCEDPVGSYPAFSPLPGTVPGGIFSVTLSVTRDLHPGYPRFHEACRLPVFGLSSGVKNFQPAIACHAEQNNTNWDGDPAGQFEANRQFSDETGKICANLWVQFPRDFRRGALRKNLLRGVGKLI